MTSSSTARSTHNSKSPSHAGQTPKKKFVCVWPACNKAFSRSEHLHRHALNHKEGNNTCSRCAAHFRRRDLLDRHMIRHKEKDDEAGGEGLGHLATRKRLWRDANGKIVNARRPNRQEGAKKRQMTSSISSSESTKERNDLGIRQASAPPSPPTSIQSISGPTTNDHFDNVIFQDAWPPLESSHNDGVDPFDFLCNASWGSQPFQSCVGGSADGLPYDDIFKPDTAMSFNAPFTTMGYYSWLFENDAQNSGNSTALPQSSSNILQDSFTGSLDPNLLAASNSAHENERAFMLANMQMEMDRRSSLVGSMLDQRTFLVHNQAPEDFSRETGSTDDRSRHAMVRGLCDTESSQYTYSVAQIGEHREASSVDFESGTDPSIYSASRGLDMTYTTNTSISQISTPAGQRAASLSMYSSPDAYTPRTMAKLPVVSNEARDGILQVINQSRPIKPDELEIISSDPLLSLSSLQHYSDLFFTRFNSSYPLIHQTTFRSHEVHTYLLLSILLLGATYSDKEAHLLAVCIHDIMRPLIHSSKEFGTRPKLWMLQTILLVECFGKSRAGEKQHDMSHLYHGMLINLIRRSDCQSACIAPFDQEIHDPHLYWRMAVEAEQKRRLALLCFMWDTQHAVLFSQSLCMNASELLLSLPWDPAVWEASSASEWFQLMHNTLPPPSYLNILKMYTNPNGGGGAAGVPNHLNALSRVLILHGLMSVSWDLSRRDQTSLSLSLLNNSSTPWQTRISHCYARWKIDFDTYTSTVLSSLSFAPGHAAKFQKFAVANMAVYHTAQLILDVDIIDLQINAGAKHIIGRPVTNSDRERSRHNIQEWMARDGGKKAARAVWNAGRLFRDGVRKLENWDVGEMFHYPWCLYLSTLMCWMFHEAALHNTTQPHPTLSLASGLNLMGEDPDDEDSDWDARVEMNALISGLTRLDSDKDDFAEEAWLVGAKYRTGGLVKCMVKQLNTIRWAVVREGMIVLRGLGRN